MLETWQPVSADDQTVFLNAVDLDLHLLWQDRAMHPKIKTAEILEKAEQMIMMWRWQMRIVKEIARSSSRFQEELRLWQPLFCTIAPVPVWGLS